MKAPSEDIKDILESESILDLIYATNLFIGKEPESPKDTVTIYDTAGLPDELLLSGSENGNSYQYPSVQIRVRNKQYTKGWSLINDIKDQLHGRAGETWSGSLYSVISCSSGPAFLDWDGNSNARFVLNLDMQRRKI